jgi:hypothetical protein
MSKRQNKGINCNKIFLTEKMLLHEPNNGGKECSLLLFFGKYYSNCIWLVLDALNILKRRLTWLWSMHTRKGNGNPHGYITWYRVDKWRLWDIYTSYIFGCTKGDALAIEGEFLLYN